MLKTIRSIALDDIEAVIPMYIEYYNTVDGCCWTHDTVYRRIHQILTREDSFGLIAECNGEAVGFIIGYFEQFDDISAYYLSEIVVTMREQGKGIGTELMLALEPRVKALGGSMIQFQAENDAMHEHFYQQKLNYKKAANFVSVTKWL